MDDTQFFWTLVHVGNPLICWPWKGSRDGKGYGRLLRPKYLKNKGAHRIAYALTFGNIKSGLHICHRCDNPICCNPFHLFEGTQKDNIQDAANKGRINKPVGDQNPSSKLTESQVLEIRALYHRNKISQRELARRFHISQRQIWGILRRKAWSHI